MPLWSNSISQEPASRFGSGYSVTCDDGPESNCAVLGVENPRDRANAQLDRMARSDDCEKCPSTVGFVTADSSLAEDFMKPPCYCVLNGRRHLDYRAT